jgi:hypothetical protein
MWLLEEDIKSAIGPWFIIIGNLKKYNKKLIIIFLQVISND